MKLKTSKNGIELIKKFEGLRLTAYKAVPTEYYYTIGYGHYGQDVEKDMKITEQEAENFLVKDLEKAERAVNNRPYKFTQNQFDALVSFTYNCGTANLNTLTKNNTRSLEEIGRKMLLYTKAGGKELKGLVRRRKAENALYNGVMK